MGCHRGPNAALGPWVLPVLLALAWSRWWWHSGRHPAPCRRAATPRWPPHRAPGMCRKCAAPADRSSGPERPTGLRERSEAVYQLTFFPPINPLTSSQSNVSTPSLRITTYKAQDDLAPPDFCLFSHTSPPAPRRLRQTGLWPRLESA